MEKATGAVSYTKLEPRVVRFANEALGFEAYLGVCGAERPAFGGLRVAVNVDADTVAHLSRCMCAKFACHGVPIGGAKAGLRCSPQVAKNPAVIRAFADAFSDLLRSEVIIGKDMGASDDLLDAIYDALDIPQLHLARMEAKSGAVTRVRELAGYRKHMTGLGVAWAADAALTFAGIPTKGARAVVQGCGRVGLGAAFRLSELGARVVGINDRSKAIASPAGIPIESLLNTVDAEGTIDATRLNFEHKLLDRDELLGLDADALILAADSRVVTARVAGSIKAPVVVEGSNAAILPDADALLFSRGHRVVPDVIASSSAAALVGHQIASKNSLDPDALWPTIERTIRRVTALALEKSKGGERSPREVIYALLDEGRLSDQGAL
jgi:glutamate dehydrogenase (NAD(P)+)